MSNPLHVDDGDFASALQNGSWNYSYPFSDKGDMMTFVAKRKMRQEAESFTPPVAMSTRLFPNQTSATYPTVTYSTNTVTIAGSTQYHTPATAYLVGITDPTDIGNGLLEWEETWASVPLRRLEYGSTNYTQLFAFTSPDLYEFNAMFDALIIYEYAVQNTEGFDPISFVALAGTSYTNYPIPALQTLISPRILDLGGGTFKVVGNSSQSQIIQQGVPILANDSENSIYMGTIICRKSVWAIKKNLASV